MAHIWGGLYTGAGYNKLVLMMMLMMIVMMVL